MKLSSLYPGLFDFTVNDFYKLALADDDGFVYATRIDYFNSLAKAQKSTKYLKNDLVIKFIKRYISIAYQIKDIVKLLNGQVLGMEDYQQIVRDIVKNIDINKEIEVFPLSDRCILYGDYQKFKCGSCVLDISNTSGIPTLLCAGVPILSQGYVMGYSIKATANTSYSFKNLESEVKNTEIYKIISKSVEKYAREMERKGIYINSTILKKLLMQAAIKDSRTFKIALNRMNHEEEPSGLFRWECL